MMWKMATGKQRTNFLSSWLVVRIENESNLLLIPFCCSTMAFHISHTNPGEFEIVDEMNGPGSHPRGTIACPFRLGKGNSLFLWLGISVQRCLRYLRTHHKGKWSQELPCFLGVFLRSNPNFQRFHQHRVGKGGMVQPDQAQFVKCLNVATPDFWYELKVKENDDNTIKLLHDYKKTCVFPNHGLDADVLDTLQLKLHIIDVYYYSTLKALST